jgi:cobalt/nickel transport system permease protein
LHFDLSDQYQHRASFIHQRDPRVKVLLTFGYIFGVGLIPAGKWWVFGFFFILVLVLSRTSKLGSLYTLRRSYIALPFMLAALAVPFTIHGPIVFRIPLLDWTVSEPGLVRFISILLRSWLAVQAAILLTATTRFPDLLWSFSALRFPRSLVAIIGFMYRYLFVLADEATRMLRARAARSARLASSVRPSTLWLGRIAGLMVGSLFIRALERSERVYASMLARGYDGQMRVLTRNKMMRLDWVMLMVALLLLATPIFLAHLR